MRSLFSVLFPIFLNIGLTLSLTFGGMLLVRPVTNRFLRPRQRVGLWYLGWYSMLAFAFFGMLGHLPLHVTFRAFLSLRTGGGSYPIPAFVPEYDGPGQYNLALPGRTIVPVTLTDGLMTAAAVVWVLGSIAVLVWSRVRRRKLRTLERAGEEVTLEQLSVDDPELKTPYFERITPKIYLCDGLPTSYVRNGFWSNEFFIYLQRELPPQRLALVLRHELKHYQLNHVWYKSIAHMALVLYWWSPLVWLSFRVLCRDMELACDEAVMDDLDEEGRREYVRTIAELGAGRPLWESAATFGECDAEVRVRRAANWQKARFWEKALSWAALALLFVFFYCGSPAGDGVLASDLLLDWQRTLSQDVVELPTAVYAGNTAYRAHYDSVGWRLALANIWTDPDSAYVYGLDTQGGWWRFNLDYLPNLRQYYALDPFQLGEAPNLNGLEQIK